MKLCWVHSRSDNHHPTNKDTESGQTWRLQIVSTHNLHSEAGSFYNYYYYYRYYYRHINYTDASHTSLRIPQWSRLETRSSLTDTEFLLTISTRHRKHVVTRELGLASV